MQIKLDDIIPNRFQPREVFNEEELNKLADSIRQYGVIEPIIVRPVSNKYEIIAGERRYKASALAGLTKIPAIVRQLDDKESSIIAFIENEHRSDVSAIEEARTMNRILKNNNMTQEELAKELGVNQSTIANKIRLLNLPMEIQDALMHNEISERHARSLLSVKEEAKQIELLNKIKEKKMSVRELDSEIKSMNNNLSDQNNMNNEPVSGLNNPFEMPKVEETPNNEGSFMNFLNGFDSPSTKPVEPTIPQEPVPAPSEDNNDFMKFLNDFDKNYQASSQEPEDNEPVEEEPAPSAPVTPVEETPAPVEPVSTGREDNNDFMKFLNDFDKNYQSPAAQEPIPAQDPASDNDFMKFLNDFDKNYQAAAPSAPAEPVPAPTEDNNDFMKFLNDFDKNYQAETPSAPTAPVEETPAPVEPVSTGAEDNNDFMKFLNDFDKNYQAETPSAPVEPVPAENPLPSVDLPSSEPLGTANLNSAIPPIAAPAPKYIEDSANYVDITKQEKITDVSEVISRLSSVVNDIKSKSVFKVETDEIDFDDIYQITIKIDKRDF